MDQSNINKENNQKEMENEKWKMKKEKRKE